MSARGIPEGTMTKSHPPTVDEVERLCREVANFVKRCRTERSPEDLRRLREVYRATNGIPAAPELHHRQELAVRVAASFLRTLRTTTNPDVFGELLDALPGWIAQECDEPAFARAVVDDHVRTIVDRRDRREGRGAMRLVALLAIRTGAWGADETIPKRRQGPTWFELEPIKVYVDDVLRNAVRRARRDANRR